MHRSLLRPFVALMLSASLLAPFAAPLGCGSDACCEMQMEEMMHHGDDVAVDGTEASASCPMLACGVASSALTIAYGSVLPNAAAHATDLPSLTLTVSSASIPPHTPPPRA